MSFSYLFCVLVSHICFISILLCFYIYDITGKHKQRWGLFVENLELFLSESPFQAPTIEPRKGADHRTVLGFFKIFQIQNVHVYHIHEFSRSVIWRHGRQSNFCDKSLFVICRPIVCISSWCQNVGRPHFSTIFWFCRFLVVPFPVAIILGPQAGRQSFSRHVWNSRIQYLFNQVFQFLVHFKRRLLCSHGGIFIVLVHENFWKHGLAHFWGFRPRRLCISWFF